MQTTSFDSVKGEQFAAENPSTGLLIAAYEDGATATLDTAAPNTDAIPAIDFVAYNGGALRIATRFWPVVIDLASTRAAPSVLMLWNHDTDTAVGHVEGSMNIASRSITGKGKLSGANDKTEEVKRAGKNGMPWQTSLGWASGSVEFVDSQSKVKVNGQTFQGPIYVTRDNIIREVSILPMGADAGTSVTFAASYKGGAAVFEEWLTKRFGIDPATLQPAQLAAYRASFDLEQRYGASGGNPPPTVPPTVPPPPPPAFDPQQFVTNFTQQFAAEQQRVATIQGFVVQYGNVSIDVNGKPVNLCAHAIKEKWTEDRAENAFMKAARPKVGMGSGGSEDPSTTLRIICAAFTQSCYAGLAQSPMEKEERSAIPKLETRGFTAAELETAHKRFKSRMGPQEMLYHAAVANGYSGSHNVKANLREMLHYAFGYAQHQASAFTIYDLPTFLTENFNTFLLAGYNSVDQTWRLISAIGRVSDFKEITNLRAVGSMNFEKLAPDGHIPHADVEEQDFGNKADTYGKMFSVTRKDWYNDNLGAFVGIPRMLGRGGALGLVRAFWVEFMDNSAFFVAGNNNVSSGAYGISGVSAMHTVFRSLKDPAGEFVNNAMKYQLVPLGLYPAARQLYTSATLNSGSGTTPAGSDNPWVGQFIPLTTPYLTDTTITGNSSVAYYGLADPQDVPVIEVVFLDGIETPTVESADVDFSQLGVQWRGYFDWGVRKQDPNGGVRSTGV